MQKRIAIYFIISYVMIFNLSAQINNQLNNLKTVIVNQDNTFYDSYFTTPIFPFFIKPDKFSDGNYLFYLDSALTMLYFKGSILNGKPNGTYYSHKRMSQGYYDTILNASINVTEGNIDGIVSVSTLGQNQIINYTFVKGELIKTQIINPFETESNPFSSDLSVNSGIVFSFQKGKLISLQMEDNSKYYRDVDLAKILLDEKGISKLEKPFFLFRNQKFGYDYNYAKVVYIKKTAIEINNPDNVYILNYPRSITLCYDSLKRLNGIIIGTAVPLEGFSYPPPEEWYYSEFDAVKMLVDENGAISYIDWIDSYMISSYEDENGNIKNELILCCSGKYLDFDNNGILNLSNFSTD